MIDAGDKKKVDQAEIDYEIKREKEIGALRELLENYNFRALMWRWITHSGHSGSSFDTDVAVMSWKEGRRSVGAYLISEIDGANPSAYAVMRDEAMEREEHGG